jgi:uncharacterized protein
MDQILIMMHGLTATGKSTLAISLSKQNDNTEIIHSAKVRAELHLTPDNLVSQIGRKYQFRLDDNCFVKKVSPVVYKEMQKRAEAFLDAGKDVILDGSYSMRWERALVYNFVIKRGIPFIILHCVCINEEVIKARLSKRTLDRDDPLNEAPDWDTYLSLINHSDSIEQDKDSQGNSPKRIIVDTGNFRLNLKNKNPDQLKDTYFASLIESLKSIGYVDNQ